MVDKVHYQAAAAEVADGNIDQALWIKVTAENPGSDEATHKAMYLQLRAGELAAAKVIRGIARFMPRTWWHWLLYSGAAFFLANVVTASLQSPNHTDQASLDLAFFELFVTFFLLLAFPFVVKAFARKT